MRRPEEVIHRAIADYLRAALRDADALWFHVPNGGGRSKAEAGILKALGTRAGIPDLLFVRPGGRLYAIEIKPPRAYPSEAQRDLFRILGALGVAHAVCRSVEDVEATLRGWGFPLRATTGRA